MLVRSVLVASHAQSALIATSESETDHCSLTTDHCLWPALRPFFGNSLAINPSRKIPTRMAISVISTVVFDIETSVFRGQASVVSWNRATICDREKLLHSNVNVVISSRQESSLVPIQSRKADHWREAHPPTAVHTQFLFHSA